MILVLENVNASIEKKLQYLDERLCFLIVMHILIAK